MTESPECVPEPEDDQPDATSEVELVTDGEILLVAGPNKRAVEAFLRSKGLLERARALGAHQLAPMLRSASELTATVADKVAESGLWVKLTPESAEDIAAYGLIETDVPGIAHAMVGSRGNIKKWLQVDTTAQAKLTNPALLSGLAGALSQAARQQEAAELRSMLASLDQKLDKVIQGQSDEILGDLAGVERHLSASRVALDVQGEIDSQEWDKLAGVPLEIRKIQSKAVLKLRGIADDLDTHKRVGDLNARLPQARGEVELWLTMIARCITALDDYAVLELERTAVIDPAKLDAKRQAIAQDHHMALAELTEAVAALMSRMAATAERANENTILNAAKVPRVFAAIEDTRGAVKRLYDALGMEIDWNSLTPEQWLAAIRQARQWKNALGEGGAVAWEKGKPALGLIAATAIPLVVNAIKTGKPQA